MTLLSTFTTHEEFAQDILRRLSDSTYWTDQQVSSMTSLLADALGDLGITNSTATLIAAREAFIRLARRTSSIYAGARFLGVDIQRKSYGTVTARITNTGRNKITLDKFEPISVGSYSGLLGEITQWEAGETKEVSVIIGTRFKFTKYLTETEDYMTVDLGTENFEITDDLEVWLETPTGQKIVYERFDKCLFEAYENQNIFLDITKDDGDVMIQFGGERWGSIPPLGYTLNVAATRALGATVNTDSVGFKVASVNYGVLQGKTVSSISGASDEPSADYYRKFAPVLGRAKGKLIRHDEWKAAISLYPDVADVVIMSQRDIAPNDKEWMGVIRVCVLPKNTSTWGGINPSPVSAQWNKFLAWINDKYRSELEIQTWNPDKLAADVIIEVALFADAPGTRQSNTDKLSAAVQKLFERKSGSLGKRLAVSDIIDAVKYNHTDPDEPVKRTEVDYLNVLSPVQDLIPNSKLEYVALRNLQINVTYSERNMS